MDDGDIRRQAVTIFRGAATYIRQYGWQVSGMSRHGLPRCSMGALASAYHEKIWDKKLAELMYDELYKELNGMSLTEFNYMHKDGEKVAMLFDRVAEKLSYSTVEQHAS